MLLVMGFVDISEIRSYPVKMFAIQLAKYRVASGLII